MDSSGKENTNILLNPKLLLHIKPSDSKRIHIRPTFTNKWIEESSRIETKSKHIAIVNKELFN